MTSSTSAADLKLQLQLKADLENLASLVMPDDYTYSFRIQCTSCQQVHDKWVDVSRQDKFPMPGSRGEANLVMKCKFCRRDMSLDVLADKVGPKSRTLTSDDTGFVTFGSFEARGLDLVEFRPTVGFTATSSASSKVFVDIDLSEREWVDYDDDGAVSVGIYELQSALRAY